MKAKNADDMEKELLGEPVCRKKASEDFTPFGDYNMWLLCLINCYSKALFSLITTRILRLHFYVFGLTNEL